MGQRHQNVYVVLITVTGAFLQSMINSFPVQGYTCDNKPSEQSSSSSRKDNPNQYVIDKVRPQLSCPLVVAECTKSETL